MKVVHVIATIGPGGAETYVRELAIELSVRGIDVEIWSLTPSSMVYQGNIAALDYEGQYLRELSDNNITTRCFNIRNRWNVIRGASIFRHFVAESSPDVVHIHVHWALLYALAQRGLPTLVFTHHGGHIRFPSLHRLRFGGSGPKIVAICRSDYEKLLKKIRLPEDQIFLIPNGVRNSQFSVLDRKHDVRVHMRAISIGRLCPQKNFPMLLRVFKRLRDQSIFPKEPCPSLRIVGDGNESEKLRKMVEDFGLSDIISFLGIRNDISQLLRESDIFVLSSDWEGMPIVVLEAMASGLPVIATDVDGVRDLVEQGKSGLLVPAGDDAEMAVAVRDVAGDPKLWRLLSEGAVARAENFSIERAAERHLELYAQSCS